MSEPLHKSRSANIFLRMHPLQRMLLSLLVALMVFFIIRKQDLDLVFSVTILWDVFALTYLVICWIVFFKRKQKEIIDHANNYDGSRGFVLISILITTFASMFAVLLLMVTKEKTLGSEVLALPAAIAGMVLSWAMVHSLFTFHYAHLYYEGFEEEKRSILVFPGNTKPDYLDFAYLSFGIGMTFQVSDIQVTASKLRRTVLVHCLLAFALNTFVLALTINLIAGLRS